MDPRPMLRTTRKTLLVVAAQSCLLTAFADEPTEPTTDAAADEEAPAAETPDGEGSTDTEARPKIEFKYKSAAGTGCPDASKVVPEYDEKTGALTVKFADYGAASDQRTRFNTRNCMVNLEIIQEPGMQFAVSELTFHGRHDLAADSNANISVYFTFAGVATGASDSFLSVPLPQAAATDAEKPGTYTIQARPKSLVWSDCQARRTLTMRTRIDLNRGASVEASHVSIDALSDIKVVSKRCEG